VRVRVEVSGRVQGVFFRDECRREAARHSVTGWVRNTDHDTVEAELEGDDDAVEAMVAWCREGPPRARVTGLEVQQVSDTGEPGFQVR